MAMLAEVRLFIDREWCSGAACATHPIVNPATEEEIGTCANAELADLDRALAAAKRGFDVNRRLSGYERSRLLRKAADNLRQRSETIARVLTSEQGKPLAEARAEVLASADVLDWCAEEARRTYGRVIPPRATHVAQYVVKEPVGVVAAFTPWNFPIAQAARKVAAAVAAGCSIILKGPEETPASCAALVQAFLDADLPSGVINLVFGVPSHISAHLIAQRDVRKVSFTGSTAVGKQLAEMAGRHMKRMTLELGGHAPAIVFEDADLDLAAQVLATNKFRNAGQICTSPSRFLVHERHYDAFVERFAATASALKVGNGLAEGTQMGPLAHGRRIEAMERFVSDAVAKGARLAAGGRRIGNKGFFFAPTVLADVPAQARIMNEEPFGPIAPITPFKAYEEAIAEANRLEYGLGAFAYTRCLKTAAALCADIEAGMVSINHHGLALPETPLGGIKESGHGWEGGAEALEEYLNAKFVTVAAV